MKKEQYENWKVRLMVCKIWYYKCYFILSLYGIAMH